MFASRIERMRYFYSFLLVSSLAVATAALLEGNRTPTFAEAKEPTKDEEKKVDQKKDEKKTGPKIDPFDDAVLRHANLSTDPKSLLEFLNKRILPEKERPAIERLIRQLGSSSYQVREKATHDLVERGVAALEVLRTTPRSSVPLELRRRIERSIQTIQEKDVRPEVAAAAVRVAALTPAPNLVETLIGYVPFADSEAVLDELRLALTKHALKDGKADPLLLAALTDRAAIRRATAGEALARAAYADHKAALRKLLGDDDAFVRYRVARALALAKDRDAIPVLIDAIPDLPINAAWQSEDFLLKLTTASTAPEVAMGNDKATRDHCKDAWQAWWKAHGVKADLTKLQDTPRMLGRTLIVLLDQNRVLELGPDNEPRWTMNGLTFPLDAQMIGDDRVLVAEYHASRVTERNLRGEIVWQKTNVAGPQVAQRLANGNTFVATAFQLLEYDKDGAVVVDINLGNDGQQKIMKAMKLDNGEIACMLADARIVRFDARGNEVHSFPLQLGMRLFGGRLHMLPNGRVIVPHHSENKVVEYDAKGKIIWEVPFDAPVVATRLANGNTLITSMNPTTGAIEVDRIGREVWSYRADDSRVTRAIRR
jgi:PQQ-like domain/HEAT repeats